MSFLVNSSKFLRTLFLTEHLRWLVLFYGDGVFVFHVEAFQFSKFHENVGKLHKGNFKRGLTMTFKVKNS